MKVIVAGSRDFTDRKFLEAKLTKLTAKIKKLVVVTGGAKGADKLAQEWALKRGHTVENYYPDYEKFGKSAPILRNTEMLNKSQATALIAFHKNNSPGTADVISKAKKKGLTVKVFKV